MDNDSDGNLGISHFDPMFTRLLFICRVHFFGGTYDKTATITGF